MAPLDKMDPRRAKSAPGAMELNRHFRAETDLLNLQCFHSAMAYNGLLFQK